MPAVKTLGGPPPKRPTALPEGYRIEHLGPDGRGTRYGDQQWYVANHRGEWGPPDPSYATREEAAQAAAGANRYTLHRPGAAPIESYAREPARAHEEALNVLLDQEPQPTPTKYASYQLPGGEQYRETLLTLPPKSA